MVWFEDDIRRKSYYGGRRFSLANMGKFGPSLNRTKMLAERWEIKRGWTSSLKGYFGILEINRKHWWYLKMRKIL